MSVDIRKELVGEVLTHIDVNEGGDEIRLTTQSGKVVTIYHEQDCCETVGIESTEGEWCNLIGKVIVDASEEVLPGGLPEPKYPDRWTRTNLTFRVDGATVISRWIGESNGYYSESVDYKLAIAGVEKR